MKKQWILGAVAIVGLAVAVYATNGFEARTTCKVQDGKISVQTAGGTYEGVVVTSCEKQADGKMACRSVAR